MYRLFLRDQNLVRQGQIDDFSSLSAVLRHCDVGSWQLDVDRRARTAADLTRPGWGVILTYAGQTLLSGPTTEYEHVVSAQRQRLVVSGSDDMVWLRRREATPVPTVGAPPYSSQAHDVRTGVASTVLREFVDVSAGPGAVAPRRVPGLVLAADPLVGATVTGRARWQVLLTLLQELAIAGGVGFRLVQVGAGLEFQVSAPVDRTGTAKLAVELGNLGSFSYSLRAPSATHVYVGGSGEGAARTIQERGSDALAEWGRMEVFVDRRDTNAAVELDQAAAEALIEQGPQTSLSITPIDTPQLQFGRDYNLGDRILIRVDGVPIRDVVREVRIDLTKERRSTVPAIGERHDTPRIFRAFHDLRRRIANQERR